MCDVMWLSLGLIAILAYVCGAFPTGYIAAKLISGVDVRKVGSGRTGGTNVLRAAGVAPAVITVLVDTGKAYLAVLLARWLVGGSLAEAVAGLAAVYGHNHSLFLSGKGGAGSMTNIGALLAFSPPVAVAAALIGLVPLAISRIASIGSISLALGTLALLAVGAWRGWLPAEYVIYGLVSGGMTLWELRPNIRRLRDGNERRIGEKAVTPNGAA